MADEIANTVPVSTAPTAHPVFTTRGVTATDVSKFSTNSGKIKIVDHGDWVPYDRTLNDAERLIVPPGTIFLKRVADGVDWYEFSRNPKNFANSSLVAQTTLDTNTYTVQVVTPDRSFLMPSNMRVIELLNYKGKAEDAQKAYEGKVYNATTKTITDKVVDLKAFAANQKYVFETGGITVDGYPVATDRQSQSMMTSTVLSLQLKPDTVVNWKGPDGKFTTLSREVITAIALLTMQHVATCFTVEGQVVDKIDSGDITTTSQIEDYFKNFVNLAFSSKSA